MWVGEYTREEEGVGGGDRTTDMKDDGGEGGQRDER